MIFTTWEKTAHNSFLRVLSGRFFFDCFWIPLMTISNKTYLGLSTATYSAIVDNLDSEVAGMEGRRVPVEMFERIITVRGLSFSFRGRRFLIPVPFGIVSLFYPCLYYTLFNPRGRRGRRVSHRTPYRIPCRRRNWYLHRQDLSLPLHRNICFLGFRSYIFS